jgi:uncharacterized damage-inducible protein DinB
VWDTIGVPHPFMIGSEHVAHASNNFMGRLGDEAIRDLEKKKGKPSCKQMKDKWNKCDLYYDEHEQALLINVKEEDDKALQDYLKSIVPQTEKDGYVGFAFIDGTK